jgi:hypothetical protein
MLFEGQVGILLFWRLIVIFVRGHAGNALQDGNLQLSGG